jgi:magnesium transporter
LEVKKSVDWIEIDDENEDDIIKVATNLPNQDEWIRIVRENRDNYIKLTIQPDTLNIMGSLIYHQNFEKENDYKVFHFYTGKNQCVTAGLEIDAKQKSQIRKLMRSSHNGVEGFCLLLGEIINNFFKGIDDFEVQLKKLMWRLQKNNNKNAIKKIFEARHKLMTWKSLLIPMEELIYAIEETFLDQVKESSEYNRVRLRINRALSSVQHYQQEIDTLIKLEEVFSSYRGNEIMKTLTLLTTIFTPIMALGALWGMNFKHMPELNWKYGYLGSLILIIISTISIYFYLRYKGWTGDILKDRKKNSLF